VRTLVVSDLHLGSRRGHDVLTRPAPLARLLDALEGIEHLVLLGDIVELAEGRSVQALAVAEPVLRAIGARLGQDGAATIVPGNHDGRLIRAWARANGSELTPETEVPRDASPVLARVAAWLDPARVRVSYPGVWLRERVWATHGHYLDRHLLPESAFGLARGLLGRMPSDRVTPTDYEHGRRPSLSGTIRWLPRPLVALLDDLAELARASTMPRVPRRLFHRRLAPFTSTLLSAQMSRASIPALARVVHRLGVDADWVVFGHVHRLGPLAGDRASQWQGPGGRPRIANTGSWLYEPLLVHRVRPPHPYWPGGAVLLEDGRAPRAVGLLDGLEAGALH
jgi:UDP-2,3-diacylglucosamine pyrophosphatase LpxH